MMPTKKELEERVADLESQNAELKRLLGVARLNAVMVRGEMTFHFMSKTGQLLAKAAKGPRANKALTEKRHTFFRDRYHHHRNSGIADMDARRMANDELGVASGRRYSPKTIRTILKKP